MIICEMCGEEVVECYDFGAEIMALCKQCRKFYRLGVKLTPEVEQQRTKLREALQTIVDYYESTKIPNGSDAETMVNIARSAL